MLVTVTSVADTLARLPEGRRPVLVRQILVWRRNQQFVLLKLRMITKLERAKGLFSDSQDFTRSGAVQELSELIYGAQSAVLRSAR